MYHIIVIDDHQLLRDMISDTLNSQSDFQVVDTSGDAKESLELCQEHHLDLVLMDICTENNSSGIIYGGKIKEQFPNIKVILMTGVPEINFVNKSKENNIDGFIYKNISKENLINTIEHVLGG